MSGPYEIAGTMNVAPRDLEPGDRFYFDSRETDLQTQLEGAVFSEPMVLTGFHEMVVLTANNLTPDTARAFATFVVLAAKVDHPRETVAFRNYGVDDLPRVLTVRKKFGGPHDE